MAQVMPHHFGANEDGRDPYTNINKGTAILKGYTKRMESIEGGLAAYYCGPNTQNWKNPEACWAYSEKVLNTFSKHKP